MGIKMTKNTLHLLGNGEENITCVCAHTCTHSQAETEKSFSLLIFSPGAESMAFTSTSFYLYRITTA